MDVQAKAAKRKLDAERKSKHIARLNAQQHAAFLQFHTVAHAKFAEAMTPEQKEKVKVLRQKHSRWQI